MSNYLGREQIFGSKDVTHEEVDCPEWGGKVLVRAMTTAERARFDDAVSHEKNGSKSYRQLAAVFGVTDKEDGEFVFSLADIAKLGEKSCAPMDRICDVVIRINRIGVEDDGKKKSSGEAQSTSE